MKKLLVIALLPLTANADFFFSASDLKGVSECKETSWSRDEITTKLSDTSRDPCQRYDDHEGTTQLTCNPDGLAHLVYVTKTKAKCESIRSSIKTMLGR